MYGSDHRDRRKAWVPVVAGGRWPCARCGKPIGMLEKWDLGHVDDDPKRYSGPEHQRCNRATSGRGKPPPTPPPAWRPQRSGRRNVDNATKYGWTPRRPIF